MTVYTAAPKIYLNNVEVTTSALEGGKAVFGRSEPFTQPRPCYGILSFVTQDGAPFSVALNDKLEVKLTNSSAVVVTVFTGYVANIVNSIRNYGGSGNLIRTDVTCVAGLSKAARALAGENGFGVEHEGTRILNIFNEALTYNWNEYLPNTSWASQDASLTWATLDPYVGTIDIPGQYELEAYTSGAASALGLAQLAAQSGLGVLYEKGDGRIYYDDAKARVNYVGEFGFIEIPDSAILARDLTAQQSINDVINDVKLNYNGGSIEIQDDASINDYGLSATLVETLLNNVTDATDQANLYLNLQKTPFKNFKSLDVELANDQITNSLRNNLIGIYVGMPVRIKDLPNAISATDFDGFIEGYTWTFNRVLTSLNLTVSNLRYSTESQEWQDVFVGDLWNTIDATITWQEAWVV